MALYKYAERVAKSDHAAFDSLHKPGDPAPHSGIYQCENCKKEDACNKGDPLPPQNHTQHDPKSEKKILWRLIVCTQTHNS